MTIDVTGANVDTEAVQTLSMGLRGPVLGPDDAGYDDARAIWNGLIDRRPALIVQPTGAADVVDAVNFAREHGLLLSIKGGGHNVAGNAVNDGGLVIDLSGMRAVHVDQTVEAHSHEAQWAARLPGDRRAAKRHHAGAEKGGGKRFALACRKPLAVNVDLDDAPLFVWR